MSRIEVSSESRIKLIGDSITAGRGSSDCLFNGGYILDLDGRAYYRQTGHKCYASILKEYLETKYGCTVVNNGCNGLNSYHICRHFEKLIRYSDTLVFLMIGANNRKLYNGMEMLYHDIYRILRRLDLFNCSAVLLTSPPSTAVNEGRKNRLYHMDEVDRMIRLVAKETGLPHINFYGYFLDYIEEHHMTVEELLLPKEELEQYDLPKEENEYSLIDWNRAPDGLHPPDSVHRLMAEHIIETLEL